VPFFARYLEGEFLSELSEQEMDEVQGGIGYGGGKFENENIVHTLKYPSDSEDASSGYDSITRKYPSDAEDMGSGSNWISRKYQSDINDSIVITHKYPSDSDD